MGVSKKQREQVYKKYNGRCAYCGQKIEYKEMQIDHIKAKYIGGKDEKTNYMPSCRACNFYKATFGIEEFRKRIKDIPRQLKKMFIYKLALKYKIIKERKYNVNFEFEREEWRKMFKGEK